ncbi:MAG: hypothetical protein NZM35_04515 [Chitinophagales bacterium]|nr:hypothetical protein [Chitinophagales bacterium]MDW8418499.1 hypothetical protein [Chitinophagales bacterium]
MRKILSAWTLLCLTIAQYTKAQNEVLNPNTGSGIFWRTLGNTGTDTINHFVGTIDNRALTFRTNNQRRVTILNNGFVGIGTTTPQYILDVNERMRLRNGAFSAGVWLADNTNTDRAFIGSTDGGVNHVGFWSSSINSWGFFMSRAEGTTYQQTYFTDYNGIPGNSGFLQNQSWGEHLEIGVGTGTVTNHYAYIDLHGDDATYPDYTFRMIHYAGGGNAPNEIISRGTGNLFITTQDNAPILLRTNSTNRMRINADGTLDYQRPSTGMVSPIQIHSITLPMANSGTGNVDYTHNTGVSVSDWDCICSEMNTSFDINESGRRNRIVWSFAAGAPQTWHIRVTWSVHSDNPSQRNFDIKLLCFNKRWVTWFGNSRDLNNTYN